METIYKTTQSKITLDKQTDKIKLWFFGDVHRDTSACDVDRWRWFLHRAKETMDKNTLFFGMGDYNDFASASEQRTIHGGRLHRETILKLDDVVKRDNRRFASEIRFMRDHLIGLIEGNHTWTFYDGRTASEDLAERMGCQFLGWLNHHTLKVNFANTTKSCSIYFVNCHGRAGGKKIGTSVNQVEDMREIFPLVDVYCMGHDHQRSAVPQSVLLPIHRRGGIVELKQKRQFFCRSGSFKRGYVDGVSSYEAGRLLHPADLGALLLEIGFHRDFKNDNDILTVDIEARI